MDVKLIVVEGETPADEVGVTLPAVIGRGRDAGVTLRHPLISRRHCELYESNGRMHVKDLNSLNGTFVDHNNIDEAVVPTGSLLTVGGFTFRVDYLDSGTGAEVEDADTVNGGDDLAAAFAKMTDDSDSTDTAEQEAVLNLGSLMDLAGADMLDEAADTGERKQAGTPAVQNVNEELDLNAMFNEQTPAAGDEDILELKDLDESDPSSPAAPGEDTKDGLNSFLNNFK
jgi:pSer/pThr/pTyr-binding forkhead associated (FHA) protein